MSSLNSTAAVYDNTEVKTLIENLNRTQISIEGDIDRIFAQLPGPTAALIALNKLRDRILSDRPNARVLLEDHYESTQMFVEEILNGVPGNFYPADLHREDLEELAHWFADHVDFTAIISEQGEK